jgi:tetratricopeptide (TPR) repeat protein
MCLILQKIYDTEKAYSIAMSFLKKWYDKVSRKKQFTTLYRRGEEIYGNGYVLFEMGNYEEALEKYNEAAAIWGELENKLSELEDDMEDDLNTLRKKCQNVLYSRCFVLYRMGRHEEALEVIDSFLEEDPQDAGKWFGHGFVMQSIGQHQKAIESFSKCLDLDPAFSDAWYCKATLLYQNDEFTEALKCYDRAAQHSDVKDFAFPQYSFLNINPKPKLKKDAAGILYGKGNTLFKLERFEEAIEAFTEAIDIEPESPQIWQGLANTYLKIGNNDRADMAFAKLLELDPENSQAQDHIKPASPAEEKE